MNRLSEIRASVPSGLIASVAVVALGLSMDCPGAEPRFTVTCAGWVGAVAYSNDGRFLAAGSAEGTTRVLQAEDCRELAVLKGHSDAIASVAFTPDGKGIITGSFDHTARLWEVPSAKMRMTLDGHRGAVMSVAVSPGSKTLATASVDTTIKFWDFATGELRATLSGHKSWVNCIVFARDGKRLISGSSDGTVKVWDVDARQAVRTVDARTTAAITPAEVRSVAISPDGRSIAAGIRYGWIKVWTGSELDESHWFKAHDGDVWGVMFSPNGSVLISGDGDWDRPGQVKFWNAQSHDHIAHGPTAGEVLTLAWSPGGRQVAIGCWNKKLEVWDVPEVNR